MFFAPGIPLAGVGVGGLGAGGVGVGVGVGVGFGVAVGVGFAGGVGTGVGVAVGFGPGAAEPVGSTWASTSNFRRTLAEELRTDRLADLATTGSRTVFVDACPGSAINAVEHAVAVEHADTTVDRQAPLPTMRTSAAVASDETPARGTDADPPGASTISEDALETSERTPPVPAVVRTNPATVLRNVPLPALL
ncbi:hypothetical protein E4M00_03395 [Leifsonia flava]|uniref:Uncharacterized protein n=1 Tax=Orlajensenia leifsoniae TaxID=2561933 RepID=A0A4Y9R7M4_9MICO|nr:hypothetical protein E4M00_03395 [Leifsonia flava]